MNDVKHLVMSGGAFKGISFLGVLECLQRRNKLSINHLLTFAGSSVGSMICALLVIGYTTAELYKITMDTDFVALTQFDLAKLPTKYGVESGHLLVERLRQLFTDKGFDPNITFAQLHQRTQGKRLVITVTCLGKGVRYLDYVTEPNLAVISAIRMSIGIPLLFTAVRYQDDYYVDGGLMDNVPMTLFASEPPDSVIIVRASYAHSHPTTGEESFEKYLWLLATTTLHEMQRLRTVSSRRLANLCTISVPRDELQTSSQIALTAEDKTNLVRAGYRAAMAYLESDSWLSLRVYTLPYRAQRNVWRVVHQRAFSAVLQQMKK